MTGSPPVQTPLWQVSVCVQASPSSQDAVFGVCTQPVAGSQLSSVHPLLSSQFRGGPPTHSPSLQVSSVVQALPSSQGSVFGTWRQPSCGSQLSSVQPLWSSHEGAAPGVHWLSTQVSKPLQKLPSSQSAPLTQQFAMGVCVQPTPVTQESAVQNTWSSQ